MRVLCFSPNDAIWRWTLPQAQFLETLKRRGDEIVYVHCSREYASYCMSMAASGVQFSAASEDKSAICSICVRNSDLVRDELQFDGRPLGSFIDVDMRAEGTRLACELSVSEMMEHEEFGVQIGRLALYETIIQTKSISAELSESAQRFYRAIFRNTWITVAATERMIGEIEPDIGLSYHTAYAYNRGFQTLLEKRGVPVWFLNASFNVAELDTHLVAARSDPEYLFRKLLGDWVAFKDVVCAPKQIANVADHLVGLMKGGGFAYSRAVERSTQPALQRLGCPENKKVVLAMLSSYDELLAAELAGFGWSTRNEVFCSQIEWVHWLLEFARRREDVHLVIRVHPREFPIADRGVRSEHSYLLEKAFEYSPRNVSINRPSDGIALYDVLVESDVALVAWTSAGMEAGMLGLPVVTYAGDVTLYPRSLVLDARTGADYERMVSEAIEAGWSLDRARSFWRWAVLMLVRTRIDVTNGAVVPLRRSPLASLAVRVRNRLWTTLTPWSREWLSLKLRPRTLRDATRIEDLIDRNLGSFHDQDTRLADGDAASEMAAICAELRRISQLIADLRGYPSSRLKNLLGSAEPDRCTGLAGRESGRSKAA